MQLDVIREVERPVRRGGGSLALRLVGSPVKVVHHVLHRVEVAQMAVRDAEPESSLALCKHLPTAQRTAGVGGRAQSEA